MDALNSLGRWIMDRLDREHRTISEFCRLTGLSRKVLMRVMTADETAPMPDKARGRALSEFLSRFGLVTYADRRNFLQKLLRNAVPDEVRSLLDAIEVIHADERRRAEISDRTMKRIFDAVNASDASSAITALHAYAERLSPSRVRAITQALDDYQVEIEKLEKKTKVV
jgi:hypothetical protein